MIIHQIFLKVSDKNIEDYPCYLEGSKKWKLLCEKYGWEYKLHTEIDESIMTDEEINIMKLGTNRYPFFSIDFYRYIFLCKYGGMYVDLDVSPTDNFYKIKDEKIIVGRTSTRENISYDVNNNIIKFTPDLYDSLKNFCKEQFYEKQQIDIYHKRKKRFFLKTAGAHMFGKFCKMNNINFMPRFDDYFIDESTATWDKVNVDKIIVHQVYGIFDDGIRLEDIPIYKQNVEETKLFCKKYDYDHWFWELKDCEKLIKEDFPEYLQLWNDFRYPIQKADFIRYCILYKFGGLYIDCDIRPVKNLESIFTELYYFVRWQNGNKAYNAIMYSLKNQELFLRIIEQVKKDYYEKSKIKTYETWKGRFVFQTTGHNMLERVFKKEKINKDKILHDVLYIKNFDKGFDIGDPHTALFYDANASVWYDNLI